MKMRLQQPQLPHHLKHLAHPLMRISLLLPQVKLYGFSCFTFALAMSLEQQEIMDRIKLRQFMDKQKNNTYTEELVRNSWLGHTF